MGAYEEFRRLGALGEEGAELLYRTVRAVARIHRFPPPSGGSGWTTDDIRIVAHEFIAEKAERRLADLFIAAVDEESLRHRLGAAVRNHLRDGARRTEIGRLIKRLNEVFGSAPAFRRVAGAGGGVAWWSLVDGREEPTDRPFTALVGAAAEVRDVTVPRWSDAAHRRAPHADRESLMELGRKILEAAGGSVSVAEIARAMAARLGLGPSPTGIDVDVPDQPEPYGGVPDDADHTLDAMVAEAIFGRLSERERLVVAHWDDPVRELATRIGLGKSQAAASRQRVVDLLRVELSDLGEPDGVVRELVTKAQGWAGDRTQYDDGTYS